MIARIAIYQIYHGTVINQKLINASEVSCVKVLEAWDIKSGFLSHRMLDPGRFYSVDSSREWPSMSGLIDHYTKILNLLTISGTLTMPCLIVQSGSASMNGFLIDIYIAAVAIYDPEIQS